jgi:hypothetical protein
MKIKVAHFVEDTEPCYATSIAVWTASGWTLTGTTLSEELQKRTWAASGIAAASPYHHMKMVVKGHPEWAFQLKIYRGEWKERVS